MIKMRLTSKDVSNTNKQKEKAKKSEQDKQKKKQASAKKKKKGRELAKHYASIDEFKYSNIDMMLNKLMYCHIIYCDVSSVNICGEVIPLENSWEELILLMLDTFRVNHPDNFLELLKDKGVTTQEFCVDTTYGKYNFDKINYKAYKLYNTQYYVEAIFSVENIYRLITELAECLDIDTDKFSMHLKNKSDNSFELSLQELKEKSISVDIKDTIEFFKTKKKGMYLAGLMIGDTVVKLDTIQALLIAFCNIIYDEYGEKKALKKLPSEGKTRIVNTLVEDSSCVEIRYSGWAVISDCEPESIIGFIEEGIKKLDIENLKVLFKYLE